MYQTPLGRLRIIGFIEGISYLLLLGVAMPMKYLMDQAWAVTVVGSAHGFLWVLFLISVAECMIRRGRSIVWGLIAFIASIVPLGTFWLDRRLKAEMEKERTPA